LILRKPDSEKKVLSITAKALSQALDDKIAGEVHVTIKVGQGSIKRIDAAIHAAYVIE
jgi:hypothetical protein